MIDPTNAKHILEFTEDDDRVYWECDCGNSGSVGGDTYLAELRAERHIPEGDSVSYRTRGQW